LLEKPAEQITSCGDSALPTHTDTDFGCLVCIPFVLQPSLNLSDGNCGVVLFAGDTATNTQSDQACGVVGLVVAVVDDEHGSARSHRLEGRADTALVQHNAGPRKTCNPSWILWDSDLVDWRNKKRNGCRERRLLTGGAFC
jgi:hypothetical protein